MIYRFSENLFFANIKIFQEDIENSIQKDTRVVIVDASAINSIDVTAADRLDAISASLKNVGSVFTSQSIPPRSMTSCVSSASVI